MSYEQWKATNENRQGTKIVNLDMHVKTVSADQKRWNRVIGKIETCSAQSFITETREKLPNSTNFQGKITKIAEEDSMLAGPQQPTPALRL